MKLNLVDRTMKAPRSAVSLCILEIISEASEESPVSSEEIKKLLEKRYGILIGNKALRQHIRDLESCVEYLQCSRSTRTVKGEEVTVLSDFWLDDQFDESELRALIYTVIFAKHLPVIYKEKLLEKLESLTSSDIHRKMGNYILRDENTDDDFNQLFLNIATLSEAIEAKKKVSFGYTHYEVGKKKVQVSEQVYTASPLGIGSSDGDFYLVATLNGVQNDHPEHMEAHIEAVIEAMEKGQVRIDTFRLDRIHDATILEEDREKLDDRSKLKLKGTRWGRLDVQEYMRENPTLDSGHSVLARFRLHEGGRCTISDVIDHFGKASVKAHVEEERGGIRTYAVSIRTNDGAMREFAMRNAPDIEVLKPEGLREKLKEDYRLAFERMS